MKAIALLSASFFSELAPEQEAIFATALAAFSLTEPMQSTNCLSNSTWSNRLSISSIEASEIVGNEATTNPIAQQAASRTGQRSSANLHTNSTTT
mmetsp:Transcript_14043/g.19192  ORF Transcript_14043/g.19192 Transcript_14043/m.19192 type:complete len:95 (-) Transcript_14043:630-914(-)